MNFLARKEILVLAVIIGCSHAGTPYISESSGSYTSLPEDFNGTVFKFHVQDPDIGDNITVRPADDTTANYFRIIPSGSGNDVWVNVTVKKPLDRETLGGMVKMHLSITDLQTNQVSFEHTVYISDVNDNHPVFDKSVYMFGINELPCNQTTVYTSIRATDQDTNANGRLRYSMAPSAQSPELQKMYNETFSIDPVTGYVTLKKCLDYESNSYYKFTLMAKDSGPNGGLNSTAELIIHVKDVKDESAIITG